MRNPLNKRILRLFYKNPGTYLPIFMIAVLVISLMSAFFITQNSVKPLYENSLVEEKVEDGQFTLVKALTKEEITQLAEGEGVSVSEQFYKELPFSYGTKKEEGIVRVFKNREHMNLAKINAGRLAEKEGEIALASNFIKVTGLSLGDQIIVDGVTYVIVGTFASPDYSTILKSQGDMVMDTAHFSIALVSDAGFYQLDEKKTNYQYSYRSTSPLTEEQSEEKLEDIVESAIKFAPVIGAVDRENNKCIQYFIDDMDGDVPMMAVLMVVIFISLAFMCAIQTKSLIEKESAVIGTLLALGYKARQLICHYSLIPMALIFIAAAVGNILAYTKGYQLYASMYYNSYNLPAFIPILTLRSFAITTVIPVMIVVVVNTLVLIKYFKTSPLNFLRGHLHRKKAKHRLRLKGTPFRSAFRLRVIFDNKFNILALLLGVFIANILLVYGMTVKPVIVDYAESVKKDLKYEHIYFVKAPLEKTPDALKAHITKLKFRDEIKEEEKDIEVYGLDENSRYNSNGLDQLDKGEVQISKGMAHRYDIHQNDVIFLRTGQGKDYAPFIVTGVLADIDSVKIFLPKSLLNEIFDKEAEYFNAYLTDKQLTIDEKVLITDIDRESMADYLSFFIDGFAGVFAATMVLAVVFYIAFVYTVSKLVLDKARQNISYLKIFGYRDKEVTAVYLTPLLFALIIFEVVTLPWFHWFVTKLYALAFIKFDAYIEANIHWHNYVAMIAVSIVFFLAIQWIETYRIKQLDMVQSLKTLNG